MSKKKQDGPSQIELPLFSSPPSARLTPQVPPAPVAPVRAAPAAPAARPGLRVIQGGGQRTHEALASRDAVVRVLVEAGADLLLRRITPERADEIERKVDRVLRLFDQVDAAPELMPVLKRHLDDLEALMRETRSLSKAMRR